MTHGAQDSEAGSYAGEPRAADISRMAQDTGKMAETLGPNPTLPEQGLRIKQPLTLLVGAGNDKSGDRHPLHIFLSSFPSPLSFTLHSFFTSFFHSLLLFCLLVLSYNVTMEYLRVSLMR